MDVLGEVGCRTPVEDQLAAQQACFAVNEVRRVHSQLGTGLPCQGLCVAIAPRTLTCQHTVILHQTVAAAGWSAVEFELHSLNLQALLHRAALGKPFGILKYAMTLDGKIATSMGHAAWISSAVSRQHVFETRSRSDAVVVGGQTVRLPVRPGIR